MNEQMITEWLDGVKGDVKMRTYVRYEEIVKTHVAPFLEGKEMQHMRFSEWEGFVRALSESGNKRTGRGLSGNSVAQIVGVVKRMYRHLVKRGIVCVSPVAELSVCVKQKRVEAFSEQEQRLIERDILGRRSLREYGIIIALYTGLRIGELLALKWSDVDMAERRITIGKTLSPVKISHGCDAYVGTPKTDCGVRTVPFPKALVPLFRELKKQKTQYVVSSRVGRFVMIGSYQKSFGRLLERLRLKHRGFHSLRHTFATRAIECGADMKTLSEILGHSSPLVTMSRYVHTSDKQKHRLMEKVGGAFRYTEQG